MACFTVTDISNSPEELRVEWTYRGHSKIVPEPLIWRPGARDAEDAANTALSVLMPISVASDESIELPYPITRASHEFWTTKFNALRRFYKAGVRVKLGPVSEASVPDYTGGKRGLCYGNGVDGMGTLCWHLKRRMPIHLMSIVEIGITQAATIDSYRAAAKAARVPIAIVETNANKLLANYSRATAWNVNWRDRRFMNFAPHRIKPEREAMGYQITRGFPFFFSALCGLPRDVTDILYSYCCFPSMDCNEVNAQGFAYYNDLPYRGARLVPFTSGSEIENVRLIYEDFPHIAAHMKSCPNPKKQWCGNCRKCSRMHLYQRVLGMEPIPIAPGSLFSRRMPLGQPTDALMWYRRHRPNTDEQLEDDILRLLDDSAGLAAGITSVGE